MNDTSSGKLAEQQFVRILRDKGWDAWRLEGPGPDVVGLFDDPGHYWGDGKKECHIPQVFYFEVKYTKRPPSGKALHPDLELKAPKVIAWKMKGVGVWQICVDPDNNPREFFNQRMWTPLEEWVP